MVSRICWNIFKEKVGVGIWGKTSSLVTILVVQLTIQNIFLHKSRDWLCLWYPDQNWQRLAQMCECYDNGGKNVFKIVWIHFLFFVGNCLEVNRRAHRQSVSSISEKQLHSGANMNDLKWDIYFTREFDWILWIPSILGLSALLAKYLVDIDSIAPGAVSLN